MHMHKYTHSMRWLEFATSCHVAKLAIYIFVRVKRFSVSNLLAFSYCYKLSAINNMKVCLSCYIAFLSLSRWWLLGSAQNDCKNHPSPGGVCRQTRQPATRVCRQTRHQSRGGVARQIRWLCRCSIFAHNQRRRQPHSQHFGWLGTRGQWPGLQWLQKTVFRYVIKSYIGTVITGPPLFTGHVYQPFYSVCYQMCARTCSHSLLNVCGHVCEHRHIEYYKHTHTLACTVLYIPPSTGLIVCLGT